MHNLEEENPHILSEERMFMYNDNMPTAKELADYHRWLDKQNEKKKGSDKK